MAALSLLAGCVTFNNEAPGSALKLAADEGLVVVGVPEDASLVFHSGDIRDGRFVADGWFPGGIAGKAEGGYFVRRLKATADGRGYGMVSIRTDRAYAANCGQQIAVFNVKPGEIAYYGDFSFRHEGGKVSVRYTVDPAAAKAHLATMYPALALNVTPGEIRPVTQGRCQTGGGTIYIPIYVPRGR